MQNKIQFSTFTYPYCGHPHGVIMNYGLDFFAESFDGCLANRGSIDFDRLEKTLTRGFRFDGDAYYLNGNPQADGDFRKVGTCFNDDFDENGKLVNLVPQFRDSDRYVTRAYGAFWGYWERARPFEFPAVAYTRTEIYAWFIWAAKKMLMPRVLPEFHDQFWEVAECFVDVKEAEYLMEKKLSGIESWVYGPARASEPNFDLWHQLTREPILNKMIASYPDFAPGSIDWWKSQSWSSRYEFDLSIFS